MFWIEKSRQLKRMYGFNASEDSVMRYLRDNIDTPSMIVIFVTLVLFIFALFTTGFTHDLLLEAAVFLVSVKLIILSYQSASRAKAMNQKLDRIYSELLHAETLLGGGKTVTPPM